MIKIFYYLRVKYKLIKQKFFLIPSFCKECGRDVHDFITDDDIWSKIKPLIKNGNVLCYDCFCEKCELIGILPIWHLKQ
jgi:hypothetical protein